MINLRLLLLISFSSIFSVCSTSQSKKLLNLLNSDGNVQELNHDPILLHHFQQREKNFINLYTTNLKEIENERFSYDYKGPIGKVYSSATSGTIPLYRFEHISGNNFYTTDLNDVKQGDGYKFKEVVAYVYSTPQDDLLPLKRFYCSSTNSHLYETDSTEIKELGFEFQKIQAYIFPQNYQEFSITPEHFLLIKEEFSQELKRLEEKLEKQMIELKNENLARPNNAGFLLAHPMARLYSELNHRGIVEEFNTKNKFMLVRCKNLVNRPKSIDSLGSCVRIYSKRNCEGVVVAIYPGTKIDHDLTSGVAFKPESIGPCFEGPLGSYSTIALHNQVQQIKQKLGMSLS